MGAASNVERREFDHNPDRRVEKRRNRGDGVDVMPEQSNAGLYPDEVFQTMAEIRGEVACFTGTRVGVSQLLGYLRDGCTIDDFLNDFPTVTCP